MNNEEKAAMFFDEEAEKLIANGMNDRYAYSHAAIAQEYAFEMAEWKDEQFEAEKKALIDKTCEWLKKRLTFEHPRKGEKSCVLNLSYFRQAMEE